MIISGGKSDSAGRMRPTVVKRIGRVICGGVPPMSLEKFHRLGRPHKGLPAEVNNWREDNWDRHLKLWADAIEAISRDLTTPRFGGSLFNAIIRGDGRYIPFGLASVRVVTDAGVAFIVDAFQNSVEVENMKFHGIGTGAVAEDAGDTALGTELTTQYNPDNTRATGTLTEGATANIFRTVGTNTVDATVAITEHGIFDQAATGGGTLLDRSVFSANNLDSGDSLQTTYDYTLSSGG